ncbi:serpin family protein [Evansella sp. AB-rgal1]|uniref:serpin family protein n=1 Tax=Evansella sp. AB-rgal1 TaxID=3242696 RepID=UPI00359D6925
MKYIKRGLLSLVLLLSACGVEDENGDQVNGDGFTKDFSVDHIDTDVSSKQQQFGFDLMEEIQSDLRNDENMFISPLSISIAFAMVMNGASEETKEEMLKVFYLDELNDEERNNYFHQLILYLENFQEDIEVAIANSIWSDEEFEPKEEFIQISQDWLFSEYIRQVLRTEETVEDINSWVEENTNGLIEEIFESVDDMDPDVVMYLINAIYFKGDWELEFDATKTFTNTFYNLDGSESMVDYMNDMEEFYYQETDDYQAVKLPYKGETSHMVIVLPTDIQDFQMSEDVWNDISSSFVKEEIQLQMPKFTLQYNVELSKYLQNLGVESAFVETKSNFSNITDDPRFKISRVLHDTFLEVDEKGTEAAAVTTVEAVVESAPMIPFMTINQPFYLFIYEEIADVILFSGRINYLE